MGGYSGTKVASHTPIVRVERNGNRTHLSVTAAQFRLVRATIVGGGSAFVSGAQKRSAEILSSLGIGTLTDDGAFGPSTRSNADGERWTFSLGEGVSCLHNEAIK